MNFPFAGSGLAPEGTVVVEKQRSAKDKFLRGKVHGCMEPGIYVNEHNNKQISQHSQQVDDQKKEEEQDLRVWIL